MRYHRRQQINSRLTDGMIPATRLRPTSWRRSMRTRQLAAIFAAVTFACAGTESKPPLTVTPANTATASGPLLIKAGPGDVAASVTWSLTGAGTLSDTSGPQ